MDDDKLNIEKAIRRLRDDITVHYMQFYKGNNRDLAMVLTKLDEAELWAQRHAMSTGKLSLVDRAEILKVASNV